MRLRSLIPAAFIAGAALLFGPHASADPVSDAVDNANAQLAAVSNAIQSQLTHAGLPIGQITPPTVRAEQIDVSSVLPVPGATGGPLPVTVFSVNAPTVTLAGQPTTTPAPAAPVLPDAATVARTLGLPQLNLPTPSIPSLMPAPSPAKPNGVNYYWDHSPTAQFMAAHLGPVLRRVPGSFFNSPDVPQASLDAQAKGYSLFGPGTPIYVGPNNLCTLAVAGTDRFGNKVGLTAGHCGQPGDLVYSADSWEVGPTGEVESIDPLTDVALVTFGPKAQITKNYNGLAISTIGGTPLSRDRLCKQGVATGFNCGPLLANNGPWTTAHICAMYGDSGAPLVVDHRLVGVISGGVASTLPCRSPLQGAIFAPTIASRADVAFIGLERRGTVGSGFKLPE